MLCYKVTIGCFLFVCLTTKLSILATGIFTNKHTLQERDLTWQNYFMFFQESSFK